MAFDPPAHPALSNMCGRYGRADRALWDQSSIRYQSPCHAPFAAFQAPQGRSTHTVPSHIDIPKRSLQTELPRVLGKSSYTEYGCCIRRAADSVGFGSYHSKWPCRRGLAPKPDSGEGTPSTWDERAW